MSDCCYDCGSEEAVCVDCTYKPLLAEVESARQRVTELEAAVGALVEVPGVWVAMTAHYVEDTTFGPVAVEVGEPYRSNEPAQPGDEPVYRYSPSNAPASPSQGAETE